MRYMEAQEKIHTVFYLVKQAKPCCAFIYDEWKQE